MKKILFFGVIGFSLLITSCTKVGDVSGYVTLDDEEVKGAEVEISYAGGSTVISAVFTDNIGYYEFLDLEAEMSYDIIASYVDEDENVYAALKTINLSNKDNKEINFKFEREEASLGEVSGYIYLDGEEVEDAMVEIYDADSEELLDFISSDYIGFYEFLDLEVGLSYTIYVTYEDEYGYTYSGFETFTLLDEIEEIDIDLEEDAY